MTQHEPNPVEHPDRAELVTYPLPLRGRVALVTGASRREGIGYAVARRLVGGALDGRRQMRKGGQTQTSHPAIPYRGCESAVMMPRSSASPRSLPMAG
jgi:hypothetical protein